MTNIVSKDAGLKRIDDLIKQVPAKYKAAHDLVQEAAIAIVEHAAAYGDCTRALTLCRAIPVNQSRSLIMWFMAVSPIGVLFSKSKKDDKVRLLKDTSAAYNPFDLEKAKALSWWTMDADIAEKEAIVFGTGDMFNDIIKLLDKCIEGKDTKTKVFDEKVKTEASDLKTLIQKYRAQVTAIEEINPQELVELAAA